MSHYWGEHLATCAQAVGVKSCCDIFLAIEYMNLSGVDVPSCGLLGRVRAEESFLEGLRQHLATRNLAGRTGYWMGAFASRHLEFSTDSHTPSAWAKVAEATLSHETGLNVQL